MRHYLFILILLFAVPARADILVGVGAPITGPIAAHGEYQKIGAQLAAEAINAQGGVLGEKIKLDVQDDACEPKQAVNVANKFATEKAKLVIGHMCSGSTMPASMIYAESRIIMIDPLAMLEEITSRKLPGIFRVSVANGKTGEITANEIVKRFKPKRVVIVAEKRAITQELAVKTKARLSALGITDMPELIYNPGERDFRVMVQRLNEMKPDVVFMAAYTLEGGSLVRQAREYKLNIPFVGYATISAADFANVVGANENNVFYTDYAPTNEMAANLTKIMDQKKIPHDSVIYQSYAALQIYAEAVRRAGGADYDKVLKEMRSGSFDTVVGKIEFDGKGDVKNPQLKFFQWKNGKRVELP